MDRPIPMDVDYYYSAKHQQINVNDEGDDEACRALFPCPFCYVQVQVNLLCTHLHNDHSFDFINNIAGCPLCAANLGKDGTAHLISQDTSLLKRRKEELWTDASPNLDKHDLCDPFAFPLHPNVSCLPTNSSEKSIWKSYTR